MRLVTRRLSAALYALWFALYLGAPGLVHPCPEHTAPTASANVHDGHGSHTGVALQGSRDRSDPSNEAGDCCCPGPRCGAGAMDLPYAPTIAILVVRAQAAPAFVVPERAFTARPPHFLPYSTAPPAIDA